MNWARVIYTLTIMLSSGGYYSHAQNPSGQPAAEVSMMIEPLHNTIRVGEIVLIKVIISNNTSEFLVLSYAPDLSTFHIRIRDAAGNIPKETGEGCRMHRSAACVAGHQNGTIGSFQQIIVAPGKEKAVNLNVNLEYLLDYSTTFTIDVTEADIVMVAAPPGTDMFSLGNYPSLKLGTVHSNSTTVHVVP